MPKPDDPLLDFRLAYLRAVARAWGEQGFQNRLLCKEIEPGKEKNIQELLHTECGLSSKWPHLAISVVYDPKSETRFEPELAAGWIGSNDVFEIELPIKPEKSTDEACALAAYYQQFPHFMGGTTTWESDKEFKVNHLLPLEIDLSGSLLEFGGVVLRVIAMYWNSDKFKKELDEASKDKIFKVEGAPPVHIHGDATPVLNRWLGYSNPFNFFLRFKTNKDFTWEKHYPNEEKENGDQWKLFDVKTENEKQKRGTRIVRSRIILNFPRAPDNEELWPIALTSYNNTGPAYPFTC